jgi:hypothetical protein
MVSSGLLRRVALVRTDVSEELATSNRRTLRSVRRLLVAASVVPSSPIFVTLMKDAPGSSETSVLARATRRNNPEDTILHSHRSENLNLTQNSIDQHVFYATYITVLSDLSKALRSELTSRKALQTGGHLVRVGRISKNLSVLAVLVPTLITMLKRE